MTAARSLAARLLVSAVAAGSTLSQVGPVQAAPVGARQPVVTQVWLDDTTSVDLSQRTTAIGNLLDDLAALTDKHEIDEWHFFGFGEHAWSEAAFHKARFARWREPYCPPPAAVNGENPFIWSQRRRDEEHARLCKQNHDDALTAYAQARRRGFAGIVAAIRGHRPQPAKCTNIADLLTRISQDTSPRFVIVVSDGSETCDRQGRLPALSTPPSGVQVVFVLTGSVASPRTQSGAFRARSDALLRSAPWLTIVAPWGVHDDVLALHSRGAPQSPLGAEGDPAVDTVPTASP